MILLIITVATIYISDKVRLQHYLKESYQDKLDVTILPDWEQLHVSNIFTPLILVKEEKETVRQPKLCSYKAMFFTDVGLQKRIVLLGKAGIGKSSFCKHFTDTWCNLERSAQFDDADVLKQFQFLFSVSCRFAEEHETVLDMINNQLFDDDDDDLKEVALHVLHNFPESCAVSLDGLDEWNGSATSDTGRRSDIPGVPSIKGIEKCVILITSRPWRFYALPTKAQEVFRRLEINGIENVEGLTESILEKLGDSDPSKSCAEFLDQVDKNNMSELIKSPLMLINVLGVWKNDKSLHRSICINYIDMIKLFICRTKGEQGWSTSESRLRRLVSNLNTLEAEWGRSSNELPHCCSDNEILKTYAGLLISLSHLAFDALLETKGGSLVFSKDVCRQYLGDKSDKSLNVCLA